MAMVYGEITHNHGASLGSGYFQSESAFVKWCVHRWGITVVDSNAEICVCHWRNGRLELGDTFYDVTPRVHAGYHNEVARMAARSRS